MSKTQDILGEEKAVSPHKAVPQPTKTIRVAKMGETVIFSINGNNDFIQYPAIVMKGHPNGSADLGVIREGYIDHRTKVPCVEVETAGSFRHRK